jgi:hypothetical protein
MLFNARADSRDNYDGELGLGMGGTVPLFGIGQGKSQESVSLIADEVLKCCEVCSCVRSARTALLSSARILASRDI